MNLSDELRMTLDVHDLHATEEDGELAIYDCDGEKLFSVSREIDWRDFHQMCMYGDAQLKRGMRIGHINCINQVQLALGINDAIDRRLAELRLVN